MSKTVLVAVDGSKDADNAFQHALSQVSSTDTLVVVNGRPDVEALDSAIGRVPDPQLNDVELVISNRILDKYGKLCKHADRNCELQSLKYLGGSGALGESICKKAKQLSADEIVVGNRGLSAFGRLMMGSVSNYVANHCPCTVTVVKGDKL